MLSTSTTTLDPYISRGCVSQYGVQQRQDGIIILHSNVLANRSTGKSPAALNATPEEPRVTPPQPDDEECVVSRH